MLTTQASDITIPSGSVGTPGVGGTAPGIVAGVGIRNRVVGLAAEFSLPARFETVQEMRHFLVARIDNEYKDTILSALMTVRMSAGRVQPEVSGGISFVAQNVLVSFSDCGGESNEKPCGPFGVPTERSATTWGITFGGDVAIRVARRFDIVPQMRVHFIPRGSDLSGLSDLRLSEYVFRPAVSGRWTF